MVVVIMCAMVSVCAQVSADRKQYVEEKSVSLRVEKVPATVVEVNSLPHTSYSYSIDDFKPGVVRVGPRTTYLKEGLRTDEVVQLLGKPVSISERTEKGVVMATYEFQRGEGRLLIAEFENNRLVHSQMETRAEQPTMSDKL
jgi:hypothetical protein